MGARITGVGLGVGDGVWLGEGDGDGDGDGEAVALGRAVAVLLGRAVAVRLGRGTAVLLGRGVALGCEFVLALGCDVAVLVDAGLVAIAGAPAACPAPVSAFPFPSAAICATDVGGVADVAAGTGAVGDGAACCVVPGKAAQPASNSGVMSARARAILLLMVSSLPARYGAVPAGKDQGLFQYCGPLRALPATAGMPCAVHG